MILQFQRCQDSSNPKTDIQTVNRGTVLKNHNFASNNKIQIKKIISYTLLRWYTMFNVNNLNYK